MTKAQELLPYAERVVDSIPESCIAVGSVQVMGDGVLAKVIRGLLPDEWRGPESAGVFIDTTGSPDKIKRALSRVADLGAVVLAGEGYEDILLNLYTDLHRRSLTIVGVI